jgi:hypothetical protein
MSYGLKLQNALGFFKLLVLLIIAVSGLLSLAGVPGFAVRAGYDIPHNFTWSSFWEGSDIGLNAFVTGMYNMIWWVSSNRTPTGRIPISSQGLPRIL